MSNLRINLFEDRPLLDIGSYARRGLGRRDHLSPAEIAQISRTVRRVPEAVVKVLPRDSNNLDAISRHIGYVGRHGGIELETDDGDRMSGKSIGRQVLDDWDLDLDEHRRQAGLAAALGRKPPKLVHKLTFSMPPGTPAEGVLAATRNFLREEFALKHRYAFVLHTDEPHPHVHAIVKAVSEQGVRLHIKKATLREWRREFAKHLRQQGIEANATERAVRGEGTPHRIDGIYRAARRGASTYLRKKIEGVAAELLNGGLRIESGKSKLVRTRKEVERGWSAVATMLTNENRTDVAAQVRRFVERMPPARSEKEWLAEELLERARGQRVQKQHTSR